jgi:hypothetical protein
MDISAASSEIIELLGDFCVAGGSEKSYVKNAVQAYLEVREENDKAMLEEVRSYCSDAGFEKYHNAASRTDSDVVCDVVAAVRKALTNKATQKLSPYNPAQHNKFRYQSYKMLSEQYEYGGLGERVPLPVLAELLVKAILPGTGPADWTGFVASRVHSVKPKADTESESLAAAARAASGSLAGSKRSASAPLSRPGSDSESAKPVM